MLHGQMYVNGHWMDTEKKKKVLNPATLEVLGTVPSGGGEEAKQAVDGAAEAFPEWAARTVYDRHEYLMKWHHLIRAHIDELAKLITLESGKPLQEARGEVQYANDYIAWYAEEAKRIYGETIPPSSSGKTLMVRKEPVGVVAAITPWNFPAAMITRKIAPALAAGCTVVLKPAEQTPFTALKLIQLAEQAGIPQGVVNVLTGEAKDIAKVWQQDARVRKVTFTGSIEVGKQLMKDAADTMKKLSLELGGQAPFIVSKHADIDKAVEGAIQSKFRNGGQVCIAANRFYVQEERMEAFTEALLSKVSELTCGNGMEEGVDIGPLINEQIYEKVMNHIADAKEKGATILTGGTTQEDGPGYMVKPTVLTNATDDMLCMQEETFGPVIAMTSFQTLEEAVRRANNTSYGLAAYAFTEQLDEAFYLAENLEYGIVGLNDGRPSAAQVPFGGYKESGIGREGGHYGIQDFLEIKYISFATS
ncbi:NAD-dependent succinate-semialdehyde dehydrogenase [Marinicrinis sediminis]|uniref:NAD-dependent succinate-semialdehyde dehydrogenase n=1 Tax=Marinicrinis sediminis TaxID=1652465 RepID=A0ABW5R956_9BACL